MESDVTNYRESVENAAGWSARLNNDRRKRLPYYDHITGMPQRDSHIRLYRREERQRPDKSGQLIAYPTCRWRVDKNLVDCEPRPIGFGQLLPDGIDADASGDVVLPEHGANSNELDLQPPAGASLLLASSSAIKVGPRAAAEEGREAWRAAQVADDETFASLRDPFDDEVEKEEAPNAKEDDDDDYGSSYLKRKERAKRAKVSGGWPNVSQWYTWLCFCIHFRIRYAEKSVDRVERTTKVT